jgi:hypothetical protein
MRYRVTVSRGIAGRVSLGTMFEDLESPRFGFNWWLWIPKYSDNGGKFRKNEVIDVDVTWLCFWFGFVFWPNGKK